jgi:hypothetical protein
MRRVTALVLAVACLGVCLPGCSWSKLKPVEGRVTWEGQPLEEGTITFRPADGKGPSAEAPIVKGQYSVNVKPGDKKIAIQGYKVEGQRRASELDPNSPMVPNKRQLIPPRYSDRDKTELTRKIEAGASKLDFDLKP